jgi:hypothetical protein
MVDLSIRMQNSTKPVCVSGLVGLPYRNAPVFS